MFKKWLKLVSITVLAAFFLLLFYLLWNLDEEQMAADDKKIKSFTIAKDNSPHNNDNELSSQETHVHRNEDVDDPRRQQSPQNSFYTVVITVHSAINQSERRGAIRDTWLSDSMVSMTDFTVQYWFIIGARGISQSDLHLVQLEQNKFNDLLILYGVENGYHDLPYRTLHSLTYLDKNYQFTYLLKTDDDMFINTPMVLQELKTIRPKTRLYWGRFACQNPPIKDGKWKEERWHWCDVYYPYAYGGMYVLTHDVVSIISDNAPFLQLYSCEDVSLGMWLGPYNLHRINDIRIFIEHSLRCSRGFIAMHIPSRNVPKVIHQTYENLKRKGLVCTTIVYEDMIPWNEFALNCRAESILVT